TNLLTGIANAFTDAAPVLAIGGSSPRVYLGMEAFQEIDQVAGFRPVTKWAERIYDAKRIPHMGQTARRQAPTARPRPGDPAPPRVSRPPRRRARREGGGGEHHLPGAVAPGAAHARRSGGDPRSDRAPRQG